MNSFSKKEALKSSWSLFKKQPWFLIGLFLISWVVSIAADAIVSKTDGISEFILSLATGVLGFIITMGIIHVLLKVYDGKETSYADMLEPLPLFWSYLAMSILVSLSILLGIILLIIPGLIIMVSLSLAQYLVIDKKMGPIESIQTSWNMTKGHRWNIFFMVLVLICLNILGILALGVGLLVTIPVSGLVAVYIYRWIDTHGSMDSTKSIEKNQTPSPTPTVPQG